LRKLHIKKISDFLAYSGRKYPNMGQFGSNLADRKYALPHLTQIGVLVPAYKSKKVVPKKTLFVFVSLCVN